MIYFEPINPVPGELKAMLQRWQDRAHRMALTLMDEDFIIRPGDSMTISNDIEPLDICFERLESEPQPIQRSVQFVATLIASHALR